MNVDLINQFLTPEYQNSGLQFPNQLAVPSSPESSTTATETPPLSPDGSFSYYDVLSEDATSCFDETIDPLNAPALDNMMSDFNPNDESFDFNCMDVTTDEPPPRAPIVVQGIPVTAPIPVAVPAAVIKVERKPAPTPTPKPVAKVAKTTKTVIRAKRKPNKRKRKASQISLPEPADNKSVILSRQALLALRSNEFDQYISKVQEKRDLTSDEQRELKRQRRLIKNRESAQQSRQRRKDYIEQLEEKVAQLTSDNQALKTELFTVREQSGQLRQEVAYLQGVIKKNRGLNAVYTGINYLQGTAKENLTSGNIKAASVCLMLVLFSFGLFWSNGQLSNHVHREQVPQILPASTGSRHILSINEKRAKKDSITQLTEPDREETARRMKAIHRSRPSEENTNVDFMEIDHHVDLSKVKLESVTTKPKIKRDASAMNIVDHDTRPLTKPSHMADASPVQVLSSSPNAQPQIQHWKPNTTYLMCADVQQITPPPTVEVDESAPFMVAFLIPPDSFGSPAPNAQSESESLLEVTCQVVDVSVIPSGNSQRRTTSTRSRNANAAGVVKKIS